MQSHTELGFSFSPRIDPALASANRRVTIMMVRTLCVVIELLAATVVALVLNSAGHAESSRRTVRVGQPAQSNAPREKLRNFDATIVANANELLEAGRNTFRF